MTADGAPGSHGGCEDIQKRLVKLHLTQRPLAEDPEVEAHLASCAQCRLYYDYLEHDHRGLKSDADTLDTFVGQVKEQYHHRQVEDPSPGNKPAPFPWWIVLATIPVLLVFVFWFTRAQSPGSSRHGSGSSLSMPGTSDLNARLTRMELQKAQLHFQEGEISALVDMLSSVHDAVRIQVAHYLGQIGDQTVMSLLEDLGHRTENPTEAMAYMQAIAQIDERLRRQVQTPPTPSKQEASVTPSVSSVMDTNAVPWSLLALRQDDGQALAGANVAVSLTDDPVIVQDGACLSTHLLRGQTDEEGRFTGLPEAGIRRVLVIAPYGIGTVTLAALAQGPAVIIEPWATIRGTVQVGNDPRVDHRLEAVTLPVTTDRLGYLYRAETRTDEGGGFFLDHVPPGHLFLSGRSLSIQAGQEMEVHFDIDNRIIAGRLAVDIGNDLVPWSQLEIHLATRVEKSTELTPSADERYRRMNLNELRQWQQRRTKARGGLSESSPPPPASFYPDAKGNFRYEGLEPGDYALAGVLTPDGDKLRLWHEFTLGRESLAASSHGVLDLGTIKLISGDLHVGDSAVDFDLPLLRSGRLRWQQLEDKLVLLSFYRSADVLASNAAVLSLKMVHEQFSAHESFAMIGLFSSEQYVLLDRKAVEVAQLAWPHALVGDVERNRLHIAYDVLGVDWPWNILIGRDGRVAAIGLEGETLIDAIAVALVDDEPENL